MSDILGRIGNILRANINDMLDSAEDPEKMIDQYIRDYTNDIAEAEQAVAQTVGNLRLAEDDLRRAQGDVADWGGKASAAARAPRSGGGRGRGPLRRAGQGRARSRSRREPGQDPAGASPSRPCWWTSSRPPSTACAPSARSSRSSATSWSRAKMAEAQRQVQESFQSIDVGDPTSDLARWRRRSAARRRWPAAWPRSPRHARRPVRGARGRRPRSRDRGPAGVPQGRHQQLSPGATYLARQA